MDISLVYLFNHLLYRILEFIQDWYINGFLFAGDRFFAVLERLDRFFAVRITLKNLFQPLYQDYTLIGYVMGFIFRIVRLLAGSLVYLVFGLAALAAYLAWAATPIFILYKIISNV